MKGKVIVVLTLMALCASECSGSAIPMWEFLSRDEKVRVQAPEVMKALKAILCSWKKIEQKYLP
jgi:cytochrome c-type biogenesis protein CcmH/NrfF